MKSKPLPLLLAAIVAAACPVPFHAQCPWDGHVDRKTAGGVYLVFPDVAEARKNASTNSKVLFRLKAGDSVTVTGLAGGPFEMDGAVEYWYRVEHEGKCGMVWGGCLAAASFRTNGCLFLVRSLGVKKEMLEVRVLREGGSSAGAVFDSGPVDGDKNIAFTFYRAEGLKNPPAFAFSVGCVLFNGTAGGIPNEFLLTLGGDGVLKEHFRWCPSACDPPVCIAAWILFPGDALPEDAGINRKAYICPAGAVMLVCRDWVPGDPSQNNYYVFDYKWNGTEFKEEE